MKDNGDSLTHNPCHVCGAQAVSLLPTFKQIATISSDCRVLEAGFNIGQCATCGNTVKILDANWQQVTKALYQGYLADEDASDGDRPLFNADGGALETRTKCLATRLFEAVQLVSGASVLDVGTGQGTFLAALNSARPDLALHGNDLAKTHQARIQGISGVQEFHSGDVFTLDGKFDLVSMLHVIEHIAEPVEFLMRLRSKISNEGHLLLVVPDTAANPFDLLVLDHCTHFTRDALANIVKVAGYEIVSDPDEWVPRELAILARPIRDASETQREALAPACDALDLTEHFAYLMRVLADAQAAAEDGQIGIFGASLAGAWLTACLGDKVSFFVDESPARIGNKFLNRDIIAPIDVPSKSTVFIALPPVTAQAVATRLSGGTVRYLAGSDV